MKFKGIISTFIMLICMCGNVSAQAEKRCSDALVQLIGTDPVAEEQLQKFYKLQSELTLHKLTYSMYRNDFSAERFKIEDKILELVNQLEDPNPDFKLIKEKFENNKLSRMRLAQIMPYVKNIINDQLKEEDPFKRKNFMIGESDLKILSILAGSELKYDSGRYRDLYVNSFHSSASIFNMLKIINSAMEKNGKVSGDIRQNISNKIQDIQTEMVNFLDEFKMPEECRALYSDCRYENGDQGLIDQDFVDLMLEVGNRADGFNVYQKLHYGEIDLVLDQVKRTVGLKKKLKKEGDDKSLPAISKKKTNAEIIDDYLIQHVLDHIPYFVTREELLEDRELLVALAKAIDAGVLAEKEKGRRIFQYKGDNYYLPELWNKGYSGNRLNQMFQKKVKKGAQFLEKTIEALIDYDNDFEIPEVIPEDLKADFKRVREEQYYIFNRQMSFEFRGKLYDIHTGDLIPGTKEGLLSYKKGLIKNGSGDENQSDPSLNDRKANAILAGEKSYIMDDEVFHISDQPVDVDKEYERYRSHINGSTKVSVNKAGEKLTVPSKQSILDLEQVEPEKYALVIKAITDKKRAITYDGKIYDLLSEKPFEPLSSKQQQNLMQEYSKNNDLTIRTNISSENVSAILNDNDTYQVDGKYYNTMTGRKIASQNEVVEIADGFYEHDRIFANELELNQTDNETILREYFKSSNAKACEFHTIIDKNNRELKVYDQTGKMVYHSEVLLGTNGDSHTGNHTPAGILYTDLGEGFNQSYLPSIEVKSINSSSIEQMVALGNGNKYDNRITEGGVYLSDANFSVYKDQYVNNNCPLYVLPDRDDLKFRLRDGKLEFVPSNQMNFTQNCESNTKKECTGDYHLSDYDQFEAKDIKINFEDLNLENSTSRNFADSLVQNKSDLMQKLGLSNGEYNELAKLAIAILGVESGFGTETAYLVKEADMIPLSVPVTAGGPYIPVIIKAENIGQKFVNFAKYVETLDTGHQNSRGLTQIKDVRGFLKDEYPEINEENLTKPENAAIATMFVLSQKYKLLEYVKNTHPAITESNKFDYLYYIYSGSAHRIGTKNATPKINQKSKELMAYASKIKVLTK